MYSCILFDFDGTVYDTVEGITKSVQYAIRKHGLDAPLEELRCFAMVPRGLRTRRDLRTRGSPRRGHVDEGSRCHRMWPRPSRCHAHVDEGFSVPRRPRAGKSI